VLLGRRHYDRTLEAIEVTPAPGIETSSATARSASWLNLLTAKEGKGSCKKSQHPLHHERKWKKARQKPHHHAGPSNEISVFEASTSVVVASAEILPSGAAQDNRAGSWDLCRKHPYQTTWRGKLKLWPLPMPTTTWMNPAACENSKGLSNPAWKRAWFCLSSTAKYKSIES
jgi:hypothetical protein